MRRVAWTSAVACVLSTVSLAGAATRTPCDGEGLPAAVADLRARLQATRDRAAWATLAQDAARLAEGQPADGARACAHYVAGGAHFFLSRGDLRHAADAVRHMVAAEALDPEAMQGRQPRNRLETAWGRLGKVAGWLAAGRPVRVEVPAGEGRLAFEPADPAGWAARCGETPACAAAARVEVALSPERPLRLTLRPGRYLVTRIGECGARRADAEVGAGALALPPPAACPVTLRVLDGDRELEFTVSGPDGPLDPGALTVQPGAGAPGPGEADTVRVEAPGYRPREVALRRTEGDLKVQLERCPVDLRLAGLPPGAEVEGAGPGPWGERLVRVRHAGYAPVERTLEVPRPARCEGASHRVGLALPRRVLVLAEDPEGIVVPPAELWIEGERVDPLGFDHPPGSYTWRAAHPAYREASGRFEVAPCAAAECAPAELTLRFEPVEGPDTRWSTYTMVLGGAMLVGGLVYGGLALDAQGRVDAYTDKAREGQSIDGLIAERDERAFQADVLLTSGALTLAAGVLWHYLGGD